MLCPAATGAPPSLSDPFAGSVVTDTDCMESYEFASLNAKLAVLKTSAVSSSVVSVEDAAVGLALGPTTVLTDIETVLFASDPSMLKFPAASENLMLPTLTTPGVVLLAVGVKVAV